MPTSLISKADQFLQTNQLPNGSWSYNAQTPQGFPEPTCYAVLARHAAGTGEQQQALAWLAERVNANGSLSLEGDSDPNWGSSLLILTLTRLNKAAALRQRSINWLLSWRSQTVDAHEWITLNGELIGWGWISGTLGWVEPTSYAMLALKMNGLQTHERVSMAAHMLHDRVCADGGWNVGNPVVLGRDLEGFIPPTAVALLALQDEAWDGSIIQNGLHFLEAQPLSIHSTTSLALTILCLALFQRPFSIYLNPLRERQLANGSWRNNVHLTSLATLALLAAEGEPNVFKL